MCDYRVKPHRFPLPLLDARRCVRFARFYAEKYGIDKEKIYVMGSNLLGENLADMGDELSPYLIAEAGTPKAFIWHTFNDSVVNVINSLEYAERLRRIGPDTELHIFPYGYHGLGLAKNNEYVSEWVNLLMRWLTLNDFFIV